jgi:hypothetical protein
MQQMKNVRLRIFTLLLLSCIACKKHKQPGPDNSYGLPNATQTGANIFACLKNGEPWISKTTSYDMGANISDTSFGVGGRRSPSSISSEMFSIGVTDDKIAQGSVYRLSDTARHFARYDGINVSCFTPTGGYGSVSVKAYDGELKLTKVDTIKKILSGTFWFNVKTDYCDTMKITEGRFDIRYY